MKSKTTSFDIAYRAGVSQSTVSRALRDSALVNPETRKRIQAIARELHYTVDKNASNLRRQHSDTLAVLLFEDPSSDDSQINPVARIRFRFHGRRRANRPGRRRWRPGLHHVYADERDEH